MTAPAANRDALDELLRRMEGHSLHRGATAQIAAIRAEREAMREALIETRAYLILLNAGCVAGNECIAPPGLPSKTPEYIAAIEDVLSSPAAAERSAP